MGAALDKRIQSPQKAEFHFLPRLFLLITIFVLVLSIPSSADARIPERNFGSLLQNTADIKGKVTTPSGEPIPGVRITASNSCTGETYTDKKGNYVLKGCPVCPQLQCLLNITITPYKEGYTFDPPNWWQIGGAPFTANFIGTPLAPPKSTFSVSGTVTDSSGNPIPGVVISTDVGKSATTDSQGFYKIKGLSSGSCTLIPSLDGYTFKPKHVEVLLDASSLENQNFIAIPINIPSPSLPPQSYTISGRVTDNMGQPISGVIVQTDQGPEWTTDMNGYYSIPGLPSNSYRLKAFKDGYTFTPAEYLFPYLNSDEYNKDFTGSPLTTGPVETQIPTIEPTILPPNPTEITIPPVTEGPSQTAEPNIGTGEISGFVTNSAEPLIGVDIVLLSSGNKVIQETKSLIGGDYRFTEIPEGNGYRIKVILRESFGDSWRRNIVEGDPVNNQLEEANAISDVFEVQINQITSVPFDFTVDLLKKKNFSLYPNNPIKFSKLAYLYQLAYQTDLFLQNQLNVTDWLPISAVDAYSTKTQVAETDIRQGIIFLAAQPIPTYFWTREVFWHEYFHYVMFQNRLWPTEPFQSGDEAHRGIDVENSIGSWSEGWPTFWSIVMKNYQNNNKGIDSKFLGYLDIGFINLESNYKSWETIDLHRIGFKKYYFEEYAIAGLLLDLYDPKNPSDVSNDRSSGKSYFDNIQMSLSDIWEQIGQHPINGMKDLYDRLSSHIKCSGTTDVFSSTTTQPYLKNIDGSCINQQDLDNIFIMHGFFGDRDTDESFDDNEQVGWAGKELRKAPPILENAFIKIDVNDQNGAPVEDADINLEILYEQPYFNQQHTIKLADIPDHKLYLVLPPTDETVTAKLSATYNNSAASQPFTIDNNAYWDLIAKGNGDYAVETTLSIATSLPASSPAVITPSSSSGPIFLLLLGIGGVALILVYTRRRQVQSHTGFREPSIQIQFLTGMMAGKGYQFTGERFIVGRNHTCNIVIPDRCVSRRHARFSYGNGAWYVQDLNSSRGIEVNGRKVSATRVYSGDLIKFGEVVVKFI